MQKISFRFLTRRGWSQLFSVKIFGHPSAIFNLQQVSFLLVILLFITNAKSYCQEMENSKVYEVRNSIAVYLCDITGKRISWGDTIPHTPPVGAKFMLVRPLNATSDTFIIRYLLWNRKKDSVLRKYYNDSLTIPEWDPVTHQRRDNSLNNESYNNKIDKFFKVQSYDLDSNCIKVYNSGLRSTRFTVGLVTMPLKLRLGTSFDFQGNLSLGSTAGVKIRLSRYNTNYINLLVGTSISTVTLDSFSTKGKLSGQPLTNIAVFSPSLGAVFEFGRAQAGIFYGWDFLNKSTQSNYEWIYNKKPWLSIGFGFSILNIDSKSNNSQSQNQ